MTRQPQVYPGFNSALFQILSARLGSLGFYFKAYLLRGALFHHPDTDTALIVDHLICDRSYPFSYTEYIKEQNTLMHEHGSLYRLIVDNECELENACLLLDAYLSGQFNEDDIRSGGNRTLSEVDPTLPEAYFEQAFIDCYGREALDRVSRELPMIDINGQTRWIDYFIQRKDLPDIAIEKNGETYHHPLITGKEQYQRQLIKQNSLVSYGVKVYRWSLEGMRFVDNFHDELKRFLGPVESFELAQKVNISREFKLLDHQVNQIDALREARALGKNAFLVVLPTGTGKTEVLIADVAEQFQAGLANKCLVMVPSKQLKIDHIQKFKNRLGDYGLEGLKVGECSTSDIQVQTYSYMSRHFANWPLSQFDYIAVDEAHHATAPTVKKVIQHFRPHTLLGLTATDKRLDTQKLEDVFGSYETDLSLVDAIKQGLLAPIHAFRLHSNLDLSEIRFNGKDYLATDLQKYVIVPSRDQLVVDTLLKYFVDSKKLGRKQGIVFCVSVKHAESLAKLMKKHKISAMAVSGKDTKSTAYIQDYQDGKIQFLTTCSLLSEGWDSPQTSIIVMARPTMSKVLYTQQLGRGTRKYPGKEALYVIDVVDNYGVGSGLNKTPWSTHALLGISDYRPWASVLDPNKTMTHEELVLAGLYESERLLEKINIFTFESEYPDHISDEQLARELFVSTGTVTSWVKKGRIRPAVTVQLGRRSVNYYAPDQVDSIRAGLGLKKHDDSTMYEDFWAFVKEGDYSFSYKIVMMLSFLEVMDHNGECNLDELLERYTAFYLERMEKGLVVDRPKCPYNDRAYLQSKTQMKNSLLQNPFEKFERKRFMYHCKDLNHIAFSSVLWNQISAEAEILALRAHYEQDLEKYYSLLSGKL